jgi:hypothetical protein
MALRDGFFVFPVGLLFFFHDPHDVFAIDERLEAAHRCEVNALVFEVKRQQRILRTCHLVQWENLHKEFV